MLYRLSQFIARFIWKLYFRLRVVGCENIPHDGAHIIVANHTSFLDPLLICTVVPRIIHYITYAFFYYHPAIHWYCSRVHCIPIKKDGNDISALKKALRCLKQGELVGIFPEGARSETGELSQGEPGVALIALKAKVPILPVGIQGAYEAFPKGSKFPKPVPITVTFGKPFFLEQSLQTHEKKHEELQHEATNVIMAKIDELCGEREAYVQKGSHILK
jgi:1-acyl-sn-glycerol-3-phosphate acyltransferase